MIGHKIMDYVFIRHGYNSNVYRFFIHKSSIKDMHSNIIIESMNTTFFNDVFSFKNVKKFVHVR